MSKIILHIDLNAFFVRCEEIKNPSLIGKACAVGGAGRKGIVSTCSYKAREYGIHSGMPMFQAKAILKDLIILPSDFKFYNLLSHEFIHYVKEYTPLVEQASIDECYCDITESFKKYGNNDILTYLKTFQKGLYNRCKLYCSIGVAPTKFLAKMGSDYKKPNGITIIRKKDIKNILFPLSVDAYYGIGKKTYPKLKNIGINTIGDLYYRIKNPELNDPLNNIIGSFKEDIINQLEGNSSSSINMDEFDPKSIGRTSTFPFDTNELSYIKNLILDLADDVINELIIQKKECKTIQLTYKSKINEDIYESSKTKTYSKTLNELSDDPIFLKDKISEFIDETYDNTTLRMAGVTLKNLKNKDSYPVQMTFDNFESYEKKDKAKLLVNELNKVAKKDIFFLGDKLKEKTKK